MRVDIQADDNKKFHDLIEKDAVLKALKTYTPTQIDDWIDANVTTIAQARTLFKKMLKVLAYIIKKETA